MPLWQQLDVSSFKRPPPRSRLHAFRSSAPTTAFRSASSDWAGAERTTSIITLRSRTIAASAPSCDVNQAARERAVARITKTGASKPTEYSRHAEDVRVERYRRRLPATSPITGTRWRRSGPARRARTSTSRSRPATTFSKATRWWRPRASTTAWCRWARRAARCRTR